MKCSIAAFMSNICSRIIYTVIIANFLILITIFAADVLISTLPFSQFLYSKESTPITTFLNISGPTALSTHFFKIPLPSTYKIAATNLGNCLILSEITPETPKFVHTASKHSINKFTTSCIDSTSYKTLKNSFFYNQLNLIILSAFFTLFSACLITFFCIFFCCSGWCGCKCCKLFTICCKDEAKKKVEEVVYEEEFGPIRMCDLI